MLAAKITATATAQRWRAWDFGRPLLMGGRATVVVNIGEGEFSRTVLAKNRGCPLVWSRGPRPGNLFLAGPWAGIPTHNKDGRSSYGDSSQQVDEIVPFQQQNGSQ